MKKLLSLCLSIGLFCSCTIVSAIEPKSNIDTQLVDQLSGQLQNANQFKFTQAKSCESLQKMLAKYAKEYTHSPYENMLFTDGFRGIPDKTAGLGVPGGPTDSLALNSANPMATSSVDFSQTNVQKRGVDEPDILKTDGKYFYYYNETTNKISIVQSPLDIQKATLTPEHVKIIKEIAVPSKLDIELFLAPERLIIVGDFYQYNKENYRISPSRRTIVAIYDTKDIQNIKLLKFENLPGNYQDARLIGDQLYLISEQGFDWYAERKSPLDIEKALSNIVITPQGTEVQSLPCSEISYVLPEDKNLNLAPVFTIVSAIDIRDTNTKTEKTALLAPSWELHMSQDSLYLVSRFHTFSQWRCPRGLYCVVPFFRGETQTLIHKFKRNDLHFDYQNTAVVPGSLLTQYSMDEDAQGNFRILTKVRDKKQATNLYLFDPALTLKGKLENIEPGEEFKASRYIGDKLYLVTFEQIDPLFVIDLQDITAPKIIWELKIPGYSTYLHPLKKENNKQYLVGLGYNTATNKRGGVINSGVKLSLFQVDYANKNWERIELKELDSITQGWKESTSLVLSNPRLFVMDQKGNVTLPITLTYRSDWGQNCEIRYDADGKEEKKDCIPILEPSEVFVGLKTFEITPENWIKEVFAKNYFKELFKKYDVEYTGNIKKIFEMAEKNSALEDALNELIDGDDMRVGYAGDALYTFTSLFTDFIFPNKTDKILRFQQN